MEEGRLTDSFGRNVDFRNTVLIMTSNIGADLIKGGGGFGFSKRTDSSNFDSIKSILMKEIERFFRHEFINRLDDVIVFRPLTKDDLIGIVEFEAAKVSKRLAGQGITIELDQKAKDFLIDKGYHPDFGARPLRRALGTYIEDPLSEMLLQGDFKPPCKIVVTRKSETLEDGTTKEQDHLFFQTVEGDAPAGEAAKQGGSEEKTVEAGKAS
jgi:ATP-dependent Clp protease ATP-binding subunit ClpC